VSSVKCWRETEAGITVLIYFKRDVAAPKKKDF
jgi:hypothetical protein